MSSSFFCMLAALAVLLIAFVEHASAFDFAAYNVTCSSFSFSVMMTDAERLPAYHLFATIQNYNDATDSFTYVVDVRESILRSNVAYAFTADIPAEIRPGGEYWTTSASVVRVSGSDVVTPTRPNDRFSHPCLASAPASSTTNPLEQPKPSTPSADVSVTPTGKAEQNRTGPIVGAVVGVVSVLALIALSVLYICKRKRKIAQQQKQQQQVLPTSFGRTPDLESEAGSQYKSMACAPLAAVATLPSSTAPHPPQQQQQVAPPPVAARVPRSSPKPTALPSVTSPLHQQPSNVISDPKPASKLTRKPSPIFHDASETPATTPASQPASSISKTPSNPLMVNFYAGK